LIAALIDPYSSFFGHAMLKTAIIHLLTSKLMFISDEEMLKYSFRINGK
jgi:hypothetical protein